MKLSKKIQTILTNNGFEIVSNSTVSGCARGSAKTVLEPVDGGPYEELILYHDGNIKSFVRAFYKKAHFFDVDHYVNERAEDYKADNRGFLPSYRELVDTAEAFKIQLDTTYEELSALVA